MGMEEFSVPVVLPKFPGFHVTAAAGGFLSAATFFHSISFVYQLLVLLETAFSIRLVYISVNCVYFQRAVTFPC